MHPDFQNDEQLDNILRNMARERNDATRAREQPWAFLVDKCFPKNRLAAMMRGNNQPNSSASGPSLMELVG